MPGCEKQIYSIQITHPIQEFISNKFILAIMTKKVTGNYNARYHKLTRTDDGFVDLQYQKQKSKMPWGGIILAVFLFIAGSLLITFASLLFTGHLDGQHTEGAWPLLILGILMFIPGVYHVRIAYLAYRGYPGYVFDDIPDFE
ncbi:Transmembrane protein 230 [Araneus ventricosus]|uniref:Transmembrane protein 230 n=2 Tax=Araneidae TaxID=6913 RepID=A0A4Y2BFB6_ARAVE|nr:Transmembrane protein 230 [Araneus ventricosus]